MCEPDVVQQPGRGQPTADAPVERHLADRVRKAKAAPAFSKAQRSTTVMARSIRPSMCVTFRKRSASAVAAAASPRMALRHSGIVEVMRATQATTSARTSSSKPSAPNLRQ